MCTGWAKNGTVFYTLITFQILTDFHNLFTVMMRKKIYSKIMTKDLATPQVCLHTI